MWKTARHGLGCRSRKGERGATLIMFTFISIMVVVPIVGLAIDGAVVFWEKAKLSAAVDAAALAAGRSLSTGEDVNATATKYFTANFQPGVMGTRMLGGTPTVTVQPTANTQTVLVQATASVPLYFLRLLNHKTATIADQGQASRRDVNVMFLLDRSGSQGSVCSTMISGAQTFVNQFADGRDQLGLITFQTTANINDFQPTVYFKETGAGNPNPKNLNDTIGSLVCNGATNTAVAFSLAYQQIKSKSRPGVFNVILFYTDGFPTAFSSSSSNPFPIKTQSDVRYDASNPSSLVTVPADTTCNTPLIGVFTIPIQTPDPTGPTWGVADPTPISIDSNAGGDPQPISASGCAFYGQGIKFARNSVAFLPNADGYGNSTVGYQTTASDYFTDGPYSGDLRPDTPAGVVHAAYATADSAAAKIRNDSTYKTVIYCIGYSSSVDPVFMKRVANVNDPQNSSYDSTKPSGLYIYVPTADQLNAAFQQIASQILRLSQ